jgi:hypothetical protein
MQTFCHDIVEEVDFGTIWKFHSLSFNDS